MDAGTSFDYVCNTTGGAGGQSDSLGYDIEVYRGKPFDIIVGSSPNNMTITVDGNYSDFELEAEKHDAMIFVKHKNYLIFDSKDGKIEMNTKGNNFKGSDKANIARKILETIMLNTLKEN